MLEASIAQWIPLLFVKMNEDGVMKSLELHRKKTYQGSYLPVWFGGEKFELGYSFTEALLHFDRLNKQSKECSSDW